MKKITLFFAAVAALLFVSCSNDIDETKTTKKSLSDIKINVNVSGFDEGTTRAAKKNWVAGDKINLWFSGWNTAGVEDHTPQLVLTYDGSQWVPGTLAAGTTLNESGAQKVRALYEGFNDLSKYTYQWYMAREWFHPSHMATHKLSDWDDAYDTPMIVHGLTNYTFNGETLTLNLNSWTFDTRFKVLVKNLPAGNAWDNYLQVKNVTANEYADAKGAIVLQNNANLSVGNGSSNYTGCQRGVQEDDGVAFYYISFSASDATIQFSLANGSGTKTYTVNNKTVDTSASNKCVSIALDYNNFE